MSNKITCPDCGNSEDDRFDFDPDGVACCPVCSHFFTSELTCDWGLDKYGTSRLTECGHVLTCSESAAFHFCPFCSLDIKEVN